MNFDTIVMILVLGLATGGLTSVVRALPWPTEWKHKKPIGCNACLSGWGSLFVWVLASMAGLVDFKFLGGAADVVTCCIGVAASAGIGGYFLAQINPPPMDLSPPGSGAGTAGDGSDGRGDDPPVW